MTALEDKLLRFIRTQPRSTQACRQHMGIDPSEEIPDLTGAQTDELLRALRDDRAIAYANGEWYVVDSQRRQRKKPAKKVHPKQTDFFDPEAGTLPFSYETQLMFERWRSKR